MRLHRGRVKQSEIGIKAKAKAESMDIRAPRDSSPSPRPVGGETADAVADQPVAQQPTPVVQNRPVSPSKPEKPSKPKKRRSWWKICCCSCLVLLALFILGFTSALAASGLVYIPGFSQVLYQEPKPTRTVKLLDSEEVMEKIQQNLEDKVAEQKSQVIEEEFSESEISTLLNAQNIAQANISDLQVVIEPEYLELFGRITSPIRTVFILKIEPVVREDALYLTPKTLQVGALNLPVEWIIKISNLGDFFDQPIEISPDITIQELELERAKAKLKLKVLNIQEKTDYSPTSQESFQPETI